MAKLKLVLDTNILISSLWMGPPWRVVQLWRDGRVWLLISTDILREYLRVLARFVSESDRREWASVLTDISRSIRVEPQGVITAIREDPSDNRFLECAVAGNADAIISGDRHLLRLGSFRSIPILPPTQFLRSRSK